MSTSSYADSYYTHCLAVSCESASSAFWRAENAAISCPCAAVCCPLLYLHYHRRQQPQQLILKDDVRDVVAC